MKLSAAEVAERMGRLDGWVQDGNAIVVEALPNGSHLSLAGVWHGVPDETLAPVLTEFLQH